MKEKKVERLSILYVIFYGSFVLLVLGLFSLQFLKNEYFLKKASSNYTRLISLYAQRGDIVDRDGHVLAQDTTTYDICIVPSEVKDVDVMLEQVERITGVSIDVLLKTYRENVLFSFYPVEIIRQATKEQILRIEEASLKGVVIRSEFIRRYEDAYYFAHIIGYTKREQNMQGYMKKYGLTLKHRRGITGVEKYYDEYLRGNDGLVRLEVDARGRINSWQGEQESRKGKNLVLTIDSQLQKIAYDVLKGQQGVLLLAKKNGEVLVMASSPSYDNNSFTTGRGVSLFLDDDEKRPLFNRATQGAYSLGSIFKIVTAIAALEEKKITSTTIFHCMGEVKIGDTIFRCNSVHGDEDIITALRDSCNTFFYELGSLLGHKGLIQWALYFGLGEKTGIDISYETSGFVPQPLWKQKTKKQKWYPGDTVNLSIGQGYLLTTPIQVMKLILIVANNGKIVTPYLVKKIATVAVDPNTTKFIPVDSYTLQIVKQGLRRAVDHYLGTAHVLSSVPFELAGKTGTAQASKGLSSHAWFAGFFPYHNPQYCVVGFLEYAGSSYYACDMVREFLERADQEKLIEIVE